MCFSAPECTSSLRRGSFLLDIACRCIEGIGKGIGSGSRPPSGASASAPRNIRHPLSLNMSPVGGTYVARTAPLLRSVLRRLSYNAGIIGQVRMLFRFRPSGATAQMSPPSSVPRFCARGVGGGSFLARRPNLSPPAFQRPPYPPRSRAGGSVGFASAGRGGSFLRSSRRA